MKILNEAPPDKKSAIVRIPGEGAGAIPDCLTEMSMILNPERQKNH